jgi:uncharacterized membrane protein YbhN (UPF0104 family)
MTDQASKDNKKPGFSWGAIVSLLVGALLLFLVFRKMDFQEFSGALAQTRWGWIGVALLCGLLSHWFRALRWVMLAEPLGHRPPSLPTFYAVMSGYLANLALPRLGEITRCLLLARKTPLGFNALVGTVVMERLMDLLVLLTLSFVTLAVYSEWLLDPVIAFAGARVEGIGWPKGLLIIASLILFPVVLWNFMGRRIPFPEKLRAILRDFGQGMSGLWRVPNPGMFVVYTMLIWLGYYLMTYLCFFAFPGAEELGLGEALLLLVAGAFGFVMPVQGGMGAYHAAIVWTLGRIPGLVMSTSSALAFATLSHLAQTVLMVVVGGLCYFLMSLLPDHQNIA